MLYVTYAFSCANVVAFTVLQDLQCNTPNSVYSHSKSHALKRRFSTAYCFCKGLSRSSTAPVQTLVVKNGTGLWNYSSSSCCCKIIGFGVGLGLHVVFFNVSWGIKLGTKKNVSHVIKPKPQSVFIYYLFSGMLC